MSCSNVQIEYIGNGARLDYTFPFTYEDELEVHVGTWDETQLRFVDVERDTWSFQNATTIRFTAAPDDKFIIYRETDLDELEVTFYPGSSIRAQDLNANFEQLRDAIQEGWCRVSEEFYDYLDNYIFDKRDAYTKEEQQSKLNGQPTSEAVPLDDKLFSSGAAAARYDTYLQDNKPPQPEYEQGGKRWYDTHKVNNYIWNDVIEAWVDYARTGPQGPKGEDGNHQMLIGLTPPKKRENGDPLHEGDLWFSTCTGEVWIYYDHQWSSLVSGVKGPQGPKGEKGDDGDASTVPGPEGPKGDTGNYKVICSLTQPKTRTNGDPLECGDFWFNTCNGEVYIYYDGTWLGISDSSGPQGPQGEQGPQGPAGPPTMPGLQDPAAIANTLAPGSDATADVTQDDEGDLQFTFGIPQGAQGEAGQDGQDGQDGAAATVDVGTTTTGAAGTDADVVNSGNTTNAIFDFTIPRGDPGNQGSIGDTPPVNPNVGDLWFDTKCPSGQYIWDGDQWVGTSIPGPRGPEGRATVIGDNPPADPLIGNLWFCTDCPDIGLYVWDGNQWVGLTIPGPPGANGTNGTDGADGEGVPTGGTAGQVLAKIDATDFNTQWVDQTGGGGGGIPEAPNDGELYGRQSQSWAAISIPDPGIPEAPNDGQQYARQSEAWSVVTPPAPLTFNAPLQRTGDDVSFAWNSINALP